MTSEKPIKIFRMLEIDAIATIIGYTLQPVTYETVIIG